MNKDIDELAWEVFCKNMVMCFTFITEAALKYAMKMNDDHKGLPCAGLLEKQSLRNGVYRLGGIRWHSKNHIFHHRIFRFMMKVRDQNYVLICDFAFQIFDAVFL